MTEVKSARIFISYARKDAGQVKELYQNLKGYGFSPWTDEDILPGQKWWDAIRKAIRESPFFLACLSNHSVNRRGVIRREVNEALDLLKEKLSDDIFLIPVRLQECPVPEELSAYQWVDLFKPDGLEKLIKSLRVGLRQLGINNPLKLRSQPLEKLTGAEVGAMIRERNFYSSNYWHGMGIHHDYEVKTINNDNMIIDHTTALMWQQGGSDKRITFSDAQEYINQLNQNKFADFNDWRLPTLEEAMSLMEAKQNENNGLYINSLFDKKQGWIWTADQTSTSAAWSVGFDFGYCRHLDIVINDGYVRAVRFGQ